MDTKIYSSIGWTIGATVLVVCILIGIFLFSQTKPSSIARPSTTVATSTTTPLNLPGIQTTPAPWIAELQYLHDRLDAIGLPALSAEGSALHIHQHLDIFVHGSPVSVSAGIGINPLAGFISPIHVHDDTGIIHVESPTVQTFTLGQFFDIWGVRFTGECIGTYCANSSQSESLKVYINGQLYQGDPRNIALAAHQEIVVIYGTSKENPQTIPSSYAFPEGD